MSSGLEDISISVSILDNLEKYYKRSEKRYYKGSENDSLLKDHVMSVKNGLEFLRKHFLLSIDGNLDDHVRDLAAYVNHTLTAYSKRTYIQRIKKLDHGYDDFLEMLRSLVNIPSSDYISFYKYQMGFLSMHNYTRISDFLLQNLSEVLNRYNNNYTADDPTVALVKKVRELGIGLTCYKPLYRCLPHISHLNHRLTIWPLVDVLDEVAVAIYFLLVSKMDENIVIFSLQRIRLYEEDCKNFNIYVRFLKYSFKEFSSDGKEQFYILDNLIHILELNVDSLNGENNNLYVELRELRSFVENQRGSERLNHYLGLTAATEAICYQAEPIISSCYMRAVELEEDRCIKLNDIILSVIGQIKMIKHHYGPQEIKLYDYPRVDCLGFLEFFLGYLNDLLVHEDISVIRNEIEGLYMSIYYLVSSSNTSEEKLTNEVLWANIVRLTYQAEYVMDLYLLIPDSRCISTFSSIVQEVKEIEEKLIAPPDISLHVEDVVLTTSSHVHVMPLEVNNEFVGFQEEMNDIMKYLLGVDHDLQTISVVGMVGAGKTILAKQLFAESSIIGHFDKKAWCTASQSYKKKDLLISIINQIIPFESDIREIDDQELADKVYKNLKRLRYLVVIDDIWDVDIWSYLSLYLPNDKTQSRMLITTRDQNVASKIKSKIHELRAMTEEESWELLKKKLPQQENLPKTLVSIAREVAKSCK